MKKTGKDYSNSQLDVLSENFIDNIDAMHRIKNEIAMRLINEWLVDESGYDEKNWNLIKKVINENRLSYRRKFDE